MCPLTVTKAYRLELKSPVFETKITFTAGQKNIRTLWCSESNMTLLTKDADDRKLIVSGDQIPLDEPGTVDLASSYELHDGWQKFALKVSTDSPSAFWTYPIETVNQSEGGYERTYQGTSLSLVTPLHLDPNETMTITILCTITPEELS